jgi:hypothetical protein
MTRLLYRVPQPCAFTIPSSAAPTADFTAASAFEVSGDWPFAGVMVTAICPSRALASGPRKRANDSLEVHQARTL